MHDTESPYMSLNDLSLDLLGLIANQVDLGLLRATSRQIAQAQIPCGPLDDGGQSRWPVPGCKYTVKRIQSGCVDCLGRTDAELLKSVITLGTVPDTLIDTMSDASLRRKARKWQLVIRVRAEWLTNGRDWQVDAEYLSQYNHNSSAGQGLLTADVFEIRCAHKAELPLVWRDRVQHVRVPNGQKAIGEMAFERCTALISVQLHDGLEHIQRRAFYSCKGLMLVNLPDGLKTIGEMAFSECRALTSIQLPGSLECIADRAFYACSSLTLMHLPNSVTMIGNGVFERCTGLTWIKLPDRMEDISQNAFSGCRALTSIQLPVSLKRIGSRAFYGCSGLTSIHLPDGLEEVDDSAFYGCSGLTSIQLPNSLERINSHAFGQCTGLISLQLPDGLRKIAHSAFSGCTELTSIQLPDNLEQVSENVLYGFSTLSSRFVGKSYFLEIWTGHRWTG